LQGLAGNGAYGNRHVLQALLAFLRRDDELLHVVLAKGARNRQCGHEKGQRMNGTGAQAHGIPLSLTRASVCPRGCTIAYFPKPACRKTEEKGTGITSWTALPNHRPGPGTGRRRR